jgi:hypothetical protein
MKQTPLEHDVGDPEKGRRGTLCAESKTRSPGTRACERNFYVILRASQWHIKREGTLLFSFSRRGGRGD